MQRKDKANLTKQKLFDSAVRLFKEHGYNNVTVSEICKNAGVAKGTFYVHYVSKEDIIKESYYCDMGDYVLNKYEELIKDKKLSVKEKIEKFLLCEIMFTTYAGYEMTCLAFVTNLSECIAKNSHHFERREFSKVLKELINEAKDKGDLLSKDNCDEIFLYVESFIRGFMASWCFANGQFDIVEKGKKYIKRFVDNL